MEKKRIWRRFFLILLSVFALLYVLPTLVGKDKLPAWYTGIFSQTLNYGLDLQGGLELRYTVDYKKAIRDNSNRLRFTIVDRVIDKASERDGKDPEALSKDERKKLRDAIASKVTDFATVEFTFASEADAELVDSEFMSIWADRYQVVDTDGAKVLISMSDQTIEQVKDEIVNETLVIIRKRVEAFGLVEPDVRKNGETDIDIQMPGVDKAQMAIVRERIGQTAQLTFRIVDHTANFLADKQGVLDQWKAANPDKAKTIKLEVDPNYKETIVRAQRKSELVGFVSTLDVPDDHMIGFELIEQKSGNVTTESYWRTHYLFSKIELSGDYLTRAAVVPDERDVWAVNLELNGEGADIFEEVTRQYEGQDMAIMLDDDVTSAPRIREVISGGRARITMGGNRTPNEILADARALVTVLNHGAYKAPVHKVHDHAVGPSLGRDSIRSGSFALIVGSVLVVIFMVVYYRRAGWIANLALLLNVLFILAILISFNAAMTLPGMAGLVLTIGMAVDANVLIFERIREELRGGRSPKASVDAGYEKAFWTIFDANVTTALAGIILLNYTSGPIYGFAVVLLTGIVCSVFTAVYVTRTVFDFILERKRVTTLSI
ncbi:MAG: protein translocase subunit SecD [Myxococcales bacterium]